MLAVILSALVAIAFAAPAHGTTFCVNPGGTGGCFTDIAAAVDAADNKDVIEIASGNYSGPLVRIDKRITLRGEDAASTVVESASSPAISIDLKNRVTIERLTIRTTAPAISDGALRVERKARATVADCILNRGGIRLGFGARLDLDRTAIGGPAIGVVLDTGIDISTKARVEMNQSSVFRMNVAIVNSGRANVRDSTFARNRTGIVVRSDGQLKLFSSTIGENAEEGLLMFGRRVVFANSIIAARLGGGPDCRQTSGQLASKNYNLIQDPGDCVLVGKTTDNVIGLDPVLGSLLNHGGPTPTVRLLPGSPAIDAGNPTSPSKRSGSRCGQTDQRGVARLDRCDIGAFESTVP